MATRGISVLGATGYTGGLIVRELQRRGIRCIAAGRSAPKLQALAAAVDGVATLQADVHDPASLQRLAEQSKVIINCVGPFVDHGEPVVRAAIEHGAHYLDTTGEQPFMKAMIAHDEWARRQGVAVVSAQAFEVAVSDCATALTVRGFRDVAAVHVSYVTLFHASQGTQRSVLRMLQSAGYAWERGEWVEQPPARVVRPLDLPALGRLAAVSFPSAEIITIPRHVSTPEVRTFMAFSPLVAATIKAAAPWMRRLARTPLAALGARFIGDGTAGPDEATRTGDAFHIVIEIRGVRDGRAARRQTIVHGKDPYGLTAVVAAYGAQKMCADGYDRNGILAPAMAFDAEDLLGHCREFGVSWESTDT
ncbi:MAG: saccharopine dehydrogenase NADP-binding domain-containing protein [Deltaproteobacteria bacterium]|nr:saccharopine dehydrogenase NADP-binding domain-containing protein [Deltaproteobacteria bacterium]